MYCTSLINSEVWMANRYYEKEIEAMLDGNRRAIEQGFQAFYVALVTQEEGCYAGDGVHQENEEQVVLSTDGILKIAQVKKYQANEAMISIKL